MGSSTAIVYRLVGCGAIVALLFLLSVVATVLESIVRPLVWKFASEGSRNKPTSQKQVRWKTSTRRIGATYGEGGGSPVATDEPSVRSAILAASQQTSSNHDHDHDGFKQTIAEPVVVDERLAQGLVQAGFSYERAKEALSHVGNENCCGPEGPQARYIFESSPDVAIANNPAALAARKVHFMPHADVDGFAIVWGSGNLKDSVEECAEACRNLPPTPFAGVKLPCNAFSYCPNDKCFTPAAGEYTKGQCWLKWQEGPHAPQLNMQGDYTAEYLRRHPNAPRSVDWHAGVVVPEGTTVEEPRKSARADW